ncbi:hypothetical protein GW17_00055096 [Ensete ventricosum]|nr:hypothetical protein GW17_00055096 [Ensete ventricosum]
MIRNIDTKIAVARKPKESALMDEPNSFHAASLSLAPDGVALSFHTFVLSPNPFMVLLCNDRSRSLPSPPMCSGCRITSLWHERPP